MRRASPLLIFMIAIAGDIFSSSLARADDASAYDRKSAGIYGQLDYVGSLEPFGSGTSQRSHCADLGAQSCSGGFPIGGGFMGHAGVMRGRYGFEAMLAALGDFQFPSAHFDGAVHEPYGNPLLANPPRDETFILLRAGGILAARGRYTVDGRKWRESVALGIGLAYHFMTLERQATSVSGLEDRPYFSPGTSYFSPGLSLDGQLEFRATPTLAFEFGLGIWIEDAWSNTKSRADDNRYLTGNGASMPIATPAYDMARGIQFFLMPHFGFAFGP